MSFEYWYVFPVAVVVCMMATASGFSGSVLFQPFYNFILQIPITQSIATGIATETIGMSSGSIRYYLMNKTNFSVVKKVLPFVITGIVLGLFVFVSIPKEYLRLLVGIVIFGIASYQLYLTFFKQYQEKQINLQALSSPWCRFKQLFAGFGSAATGTGVAEIHQPIFEFDVGLNITRANASAILIEAIGNWMITLFNLSANNINFDILIFSASGTLVGGQLGPIVSQYIPDKILKTIFGISVSTIGIIYIVTSLKKILAFF